MMRLPRFSVAALMLAAVICTSARAQVLQQVPSDAMLVVKIKNVQALNDKLAFFMQDWGLVELKPELKDPLNTLLGMGGLGAGLDKAGEAAIALMMPAGGGGPEAVVFVPVTDFKAFAASLPNAKDEGELTTFKPSGKAVFAANRGKYAVLSDKKELLSKPAQGIALSPGAAKLLADRDVSVVFNVKMIRAQVLPPLQQNKQMMLQMMEQQMQQQGTLDPKFAPAMKAYMGQIFNVMEGFLKEADAVSLGLNLSKDGIASTLLTEFDPASYMGQAMTKMKNSDQSFTSGLPAGTYLFYGGMTMDAQAVQLINDFLAPIEKEIKALGDDGKPIAKYLDAMRRSLGATRYSTLGVMTGGVANMQKTGIVQLVSITGGDTRVILDAQREISAGQAEFGKITGGPGLTSTLTPKAKTVQGVELDKITMDVDAKNNTPQAQMAGMFIKMLFGPGGMTGHMGAVDAQKMISVIGNDDALIDNAVSAAKNNADPLGKGQAAATVKGLPQNRLAAFYVPVDQIAKTVLEFLAMRGLPAGVKIPENLPPMGMTIASEGPSVRIDGFAPEASIKAMISAGMQVYLMQMPGNQPGGPARP